MKTIVATCDKYDHLMPGFARQFNKYWGKEDVTVLCFRQPPPLPDNFTAVSLADKETLPWTEHMLPFFQDMRRDIDDYFLFLLDDYWMVANANHNNNATLWHITASGADKGDLSDNTLCFGASSYFEPGFIVANQGAKYRLSTQPAYWRLDYMISYLRSGWNIWDFERLGSRAANNDGAKIIALDKPKGYTGYPYANVYKKGKVDMRQVAKIPEEDRVALASLGYGEMLNGGCE